MANNLVRDIMTPEPIALASDASLREAANAMSSEDVGAVLVEKGGKVTGIVSDRDIVVRAVAQGKDLESTKISDICSADLATLAPDDSIDDAVRLMRERAVRRVPVVENGVAVGIVSLGDLALERDAKSVLGQISRATPNA
jgi:CBS domain-containing protein